MLNTFYTFARMLTRSLSSGVETSLVIVSDMFSFWFKDFVVLCFENTKQLLN